MSLLRNLVLFVLGLVLPAAAAEFRWSERLAPGQTLEIKTVNGSLTVTLPDTASTEVKARTVNGDIRTDFPLAVRGGLVGHKLEGTLGSGGRSLSLETVNGSVHLRKVR